MIKAEISGNKEDGLWILITEEHNDLLGSYAIAEEELIPILEAIKLYLGKQ